MNLRLWKLRRHCWLAFCAYVLSWLCDSCWHAQLQSQNSCVGKLLSNANNMRSFDATIKQCAHVNAQKPKFCVHVLMTSSTRGRRIWVFVRWHAHIVWLWHQMNACCLHLTTICQHSYFVIAVAHVNSCHKVRTTHKHKKLVNSVGAIFTNADSLSLWHSKRRLFALMRRFLLTNADFC